MQATSRCQARFNGAALRRARSATAPQTHIAMPVPLQRGRAPESAECEPPAQPTDGPDTASTGPRSGERGVEPKAAGSATLTKLQRGRAPESAECRTSAPVHSRNKWLQRGRAPESAEWRRERSDRSNHHRLLQRGRAPESAECSPSSFATSRQWVASTGPRSGERGVAPSVALRVTRVFASTGPRSGERGVVVSITLFAAAFLCFNGAALRRARSVSSLDVNLNTVDRLQRGRAPESAECS